MIMALYPWINTIIVAGTLGLFGIAVLMKERKMSRMFKKPIPAEKDPEVWRLAGKVGMKNARRRKRRGKSEEAEEIRKNAEAAFQKAELLEREYGSNR